ncbi:MAG: UDP-N-acetylmuramoyl-tripeptide--D-alanyl-D-alanine ligase [Gaiellaceae bacterium]
MIPLGLDEVEGLCGGNLVRAGWTGEVTGVQIDSRRVDEGDLFVAVGGGSAFRDHAFARGAAAVLLPDDAFAALGVLGRTVRERSSARVVGITGSTGKTSTKDILFALCRRHARTVAAEASYNAELGVPLTLCRLESDTELCVLELAMRGFGQIAALCEIARPHVGVITTIAAAHLEFVGSLTGVARAKAELLAALPDGGVAIVPAGAPGLDEHLRSDLDVRRFGRGGEAVLEHFERAGQGSRATYRLGDRMLDLELSLTARHQAENALPALLAYDALGLPLDRAHEGARTIELSRWRGDEVPLPGGGLLINDAYNANPLSMRAALAHLVERAEGRRTVAVLGDMAELGPDAPAYHEEVGRNVRDLGIDALLAVGPLAAGYLRGAEGLASVEWVADLPGALERLDTFVRPGDCVLVKASRAAGLEEIAEALGTVLA